MGRASDGPPVGMPPDRGAWLPDREFRYVVTEFTLDPGHAARRSGYRPIWRMTVPGAEPVLVGMCALALVEKDRIEPGEAQVVQWVFVPDVQGYIEHLLPPGTCAEVCDGSRRVGAVRVLEFVY